MNSNKFYVAVLMGLVGFARSYTGTDFGFTEVEANSVIAAITAGLIWLVPNGKPFWRFFGK